MTIFLESVNRFVWGLPALALILGVGLFLSVRTGFAQITLFPQAFRLFFASLTVKDGEGTSPFRALCTALAATVGTGNLVGVAGAICLGGPGSIFWMWICGLLGMATKYAEATLAVRYRVKSGEEWIGGPMYVIREGLGGRFRPLAGLYALFGIIASFGVGNAAQINAVVSGCNDVIIRLGGGETAGGNLIMGLILAGLLGAMLLGGAERIGKTAELLVPFLSGAYILLCAGVLILRWQFLPHVFSEIIRGAFSPKAVTGGALGSAFTALRVGCSRGVFTNEAGMGTASIAHASADVEHPARQGLMGIMEVFLDTIVICTLTALVILSSGVPIGYGMDPGGILTTQAFSEVYGNWVSGFLAAALCCFAFATVLGWGLYGGRCAQYLFGDGAWRTYAWCQTAVVVLGAVGEPGLIWTLSETVNGLMAIPNLIALAVLSPEIHRLTIDFKKKTDLRAGGGTYANFHQRQSL